MLIPAQLFDIRKLRYFLATVECGSFRGASAALNVRASSVSRGVRDLEDKLGVPLFERHNGGVFLTSAGERFLQPARAAMIHLRDGMRDVGAISRSKSGHICVGIFSSLASGFLAETFRTFNRQHPDVQVRFVEGRSTEHISAVKLHEIDIAFAAGTAQHGGCSSKHFWSERMFGVLPSTHRLANRETLSWFDVATESIIVNGEYPDRELADYISANIFSFGRRSDIKFQNVCRDNLMSLVAIGLGMTIATESVTANSFLGVVYRPILGETIPFSAVWSDKNDNPALRDLLSIMAGWEATERSLFSSSPIAARQSS